MSEQTDEPTSANPAEMYQSFFVPAVHGPFADILIDRAKLRSGDRVLDVGCGTGAVTLRAAKRVGKDGAVTGLDPNPHMLAVARSLSAGNQSITWVEGGAEALPFADRSFDVVLCQQSLQFFADRAAAAREMHRVLVSGGRIGISVWRSIEHQSLYKLFDEATVRHLGALPEAVSPFSLGDAGELRKLFGAAGFDQIEIESVSGPVKFSQPDQFAELTIQAAASVLPEYEEMDQSVRDSLVSAIKQDLAEPIAEHTVNGQLVFPMTTHIVTATA